MAHRDDLDVITTDLVAGLWKRVDEAIEKRGVNRKDVPPHIHEKLHYSITRESVLTLSVVLKKAIEEMTRTGLMKEFP